MIRFISIRDWPDHSLLNTCQAFFQFPFSPMAGRILDRVQGHTSIGRSRNFVHLVTGHTPGRINRNGTVWQQGVTFTANTVICSLPVPRCVNTIFPRNYVLLAACTSPCQKERASVMHQYFHVWVFLLVKAGIIQKKPTKSRKKPQIQKARQMSYVRVSHIWCAGNHRHSIYGNFELRLRVMSHLVLPQWMLDVI